MNGLADFVSQMEKAFRDEDRRRTEHKLALLTLAAITVQHGGAMEIPKAELAVLMDREDGFILEVDGPRGLVSCRIVAKDEIESEKALIEERATQLEEH